MKEEISGLSRSQRVYGLQKRTDGGVETPNLEATELGTEGIPSTSSVETVGAVIEADGRIVVIRPDD